MNKKATIFLCTLTILSLCACGRISDQGMQAPSTQSPSNSTQTNSEQPQMITAEDAKKIALDEVRGATLEDIREFEEDYDNGKLKFEGKIHYDQNEIEFEIDAYGAITKWEVEPLYREGK